MMMADAEDSGVSLPILDQSSLSESPPLVFQCSQCNNVVGDSLSWVSADKIMRTITLSRKNIFEYILALGRLPERFEMPFSPYRFFLSHVQFGSIVASG